MFAQLAAARHQRVCGVQEQEVLAAGTAASSRPGPCHRWPLGGENLTDQRPSEERLETFEKKLKIIF